MVRVKSSKASSSMDWIAMESEQCPLASNAEHVNWKTLGFALDEVELASAIQAAGGNQTQDPGAHGL